MRKIRENFELPFSLFLFLAGMGWSSSSQAANPTYSFIRETLPNTSIRLRVIEEDTDLRGDQSRISQRVVRDEVFSASESSRIDDIGRDYTTPTRLNTPLAPFPKSGKPLWVASKTSWTRADEDDYSHWFATEVDTNFDTGTGLLADCADMGQLFRWVYAREHRLPMANSLTSGKLFGHFSSNQAWDELSTDPDWKKDERFKAAMRYLMANSYTGTLYNDLYPTLVNPQYVRPGSLFMIIRTVSGHTQTISKIDPNYGITTLWGNEPAAEDIYSSGIIIEFQNKEGFKMWRTPQWVNSTWELIPGPQMPGYSEEQYQIGASTESEFEVWFDQRLGIAVDDEYQLQALVDSYVTNIDLRMNVTSEGLSACYFHTCDPSSGDYSAYSTFSRDARISTLREQILDLISKLGSSNQTVQAEIGTLTDHGEIIIGSGLTYLSLIQDPNQMSKLNADPRVSFAARWGLDDTQNPTLSFYTLAQALNVLIKDRDTLVNSASTQCLNGTPCNPSSETTKSLNTVALDTNIRNVIEQANASAQESSFDSSALVSVKSYFDQTALTSMPQNDFCTDPNQCTYNDVIWATGANLRLTQWSSNPNDSVKSRWGSNGTKRSPARLL